MSENTQYAIMPLQDYTDTCDVIRKKTGISNTIESGELSTKVEEVYNIGYKLGVNTSSSEPTYISQSGNPVIINNPSEVPCTINIQLCHANNETTDYSGIQLIKCGYNLFDGKFEYGYINDKGENVTSSKYIRTVNYISIMPNTTFRLVKFDGGIHKTYFRFYDRDKKYIGLITASTLDDLQFTSPNEAYYLKVYFYACQDLDKELIITFPQFELINEYSGELTIYTSGEDGVITSITSLYPKIILFTDNEHILISVHYVIHDSDNEYTTYRLGRDIQYNKFWDAYQENGNRTNYAYAFHRTFWNNETFKPKYDIIPEGNTSQMFIYSPITNIKSSLDQCGVILDFSKVTKLDGTFQAAKTRELPVLDLSSCTTIQLGLYNMENVKSLTINNLREDCSFDRAMTYNYNLENLTMTGTIGKNGIDVQHSTNLTYDSLMNVISCLKDFRLVKNLFISCDYQQGVIENYQLMEGDTYILTYEADGINPRELTAVVGDVFVFPSNINATGLQFDLANDGRVDIVWIYVFGNGEVLMCETTMNNPNQKISLIKQETHTITLGKTNLAKLSDDEKAIATEKGWSLV